MIAHVVLNGLVQMSQIRLSSASVTHRPLISRFRATVDNLDHGQVFFSLSEKEFFLNNFTLYSA